MNGIATINLLGKQAFGFAWPMFWQSSLLIAIVFALDLGLRRKVRPNFRYALWVVVLLKLLLPPSLAFPSGIGWWVRPSTPAAASHRQAIMQVIHGPERADIVPELSMPTPAAASSPVVSFAGCGLVAWTCASLTLLGWMLVRCRQVAREIRKANAAPDWLQGLLEDTRREAGVSYSVRVKLLERSGSPTVSGLFCPTILVPAPLLGHLGPDQVRAVLLHELMHIRRGDAWVNCAQTLLQSFYCWHPLLWLANARTRHVREEAVDDAVMLALGNRSDTYAPTLLEVAKLALRRPMASLGLVGILESRSFLRQRIERLIDFRPPARAGLTLGSIVSVLAFAALALPMGEAPLSSSPPPVVTTSGDNPWPDARFAGYAEIKLEPQFLIVPETSLHAVLPSLTGAQEPLLFTSNDVAELNSQLKRAEAQPYTPAAPLSFGKFSGGMFHWLVGGVTNNGVNYLTRSAGGQAVVTGADVTVLATQPDWIPLDLTLIPWSSDSGVRCQMRLGLADNPNSAQEADVTIPKGGALVWAILVADNSGKYELVVLQESSDNTNERDSFHTLANPSGQQDSVSSVSTDHALDPTPAEPASPKAPMSGDTLRFEGKLWSFESSSPGTDLGTGIVRGTNGALMRYGPTVLTADQVTAVISNHQLVGVVADGNVRLQQGTQLLESDHLRINPSDPPRRRAIAAARDQFAVANQLFINSAKSAEPAASTDAETIMSLLNKDLIFRQLREIRVPKAFFNNVRLREVLAHLNDYVPETGSGEKPLTFTYEQGLDDIGEVAITIEPALIDVTLAEVVDAVAKVSRSPLTYSLTSTGVVFARKTETAGRQGPMQVNLKTMFVTLPEDSGASMWNLFGGTNPAGNSTPSFSTVLTPAQCAVLVRALASNPVVDLFRDASVTTVSGRKTEVQVVDLKTVVTNLNPLALVPPGISSKPNGTNGLYQTATNPFGTTLDSVASVLADRHHIQLVAHVSSTEFLGYDDPKGKVPAYVDGQRTNVLRPLPHFRVAEITASVEVPDGHTLLLGTAMNDESPSATSVLGLKKKRLLILVTPTLIDPAGNRLHPEN